MVGFGRPAVLLAEPWTNEEEPLVTGETEKGKHFSKAGGGGGEVAHFPAQVPARKMSLL